MQAVATVSFMIGDDEVMISADVDYRVEGRATPGTRETPPEYPELIIESVTSEMFGRPLTIPLEYIINEEDLEQELWNDYEESQDQEQDE